MSELAIWKTVWLNRAVALAATTILLLALVRVVGGFSMGDEQQEPSSPPSTTPVTSPSGPAEQPADQPVQQLQPPTDFGQQVAAKGGLPADLETRIHKIENE
jgi:hypothetical protein